MESGSDQLRVKVISSTKKAFVWLSPCQPPNHSAHLNMGMVLEHARFVISALVAISGQPNGITVEWCIVYIEYSSVPTNVKHAPPIGYSTESECK